MTRLTFSKMHGLGNSFMVIDQINQPPIKLSPSIITQLADPNKGVGFDQLLIIAPPSVPDADFDYLIFNSDGSEVEQCGNGARCFLEYIHQKRLSKKDEIVVNTLGGIIKPKRVNDNAISVDMGPPNFDPHALPFIPLNDPDVTAPMLHNINIKNDETLSIGIVSMGNPHAVIFVNDIDNFPVETIGPIIENHVQFPNRTNVGFLQVVDPKHAKLRVYERGAGETEACGTGACAAAVIGQAFGKLDNDVSIRLRGGELSIHWSGQKDDSVYLEGPAELIFDGEITLPE